MTDEQAKAFNAVIIEKLGDAASQETRSEAAAAISNYTQDKMWRLQHIPTRYYMSPDDVHLAKLYEEMTKYGYIALDKDGKPACLTGNPPVIAHKPETP